MMNNQYDGRYGATVETFLPNRRRRNTTKRTLAAIAAALVALTLGLIVLLLIGIETGLVGLMVGFILATLPVPIYTLLVLWLDRYESEPLWMLAAAFLWGALVSFIAAFFLNTTGSIIVFLAAGERAADFAGGSVFAPIVEESAKAIALFILFFWKRQEFDGVLDGIVYAAMVGLGFAMTENMLYYGRAALEGAQFGTFILRGIFSPYAHPLFTSMTGIGLGLATQTRNPLVRFIGPLLGFGMAIFLHSLWNTAAFLSGAIQNGWVVLGMYFLIMVPLFFAVLVGILFALRREGRIVREHLYCDLQSGFFTAHEYQRLCSIPGRMGASFGALTGGGLGMWRARMQFHRAASDLAFHRNRMANGLLAENAEAAELERMHVQMLREIRARLGSH